MGEAVAAADFSDAVWIDQGGKLFDNLYTLFRSLSLRFICAGATGLFGQSPAGQGGVQGAAFLASTPRGSSCHDEPAENSGDRSLGTLFIAFLKVAFCGLGGGLVWARRIAIEQRRWISEEEFADSLGTCQFMPGPNIVGIAVCTGAKLRGLAGAVATASGFVLIPLTIGFMLGVIYLRHAQLVGRAGARDRELDEVIWHSTLGIIADHLCLNQCSRWRCGLDGRHHRRLVG
jgi:hypothetical protein